MNNQEFTEAFERLTGEKIERIEWVYLVAQEGTMTNHLEVTLQIILKEKPPETWCFVSYRTICTDPLNAIQSADSDIEFYLGKALNGYTTGRHDFVVMLMDSYVMEWWKEAIKSSEKELSYFESM